MPNILDSLDETQRKAATFAEGALLIGAGPGSGKTRVLTHRMAYLISQQIPYSRILMITFTKNAAEEMCERVYVLTGIPEEALAKNIMTFHSLGARILLSCQWALPFKLTQPNPINPSKCRQILSKICQDTGTKYAIMRSYIAIQKRHDRSPDHAMIDATEDDSGWESDHAAERFAKIYSMYEDGKRLMGALDLDDLVYWGSQLLRSNDRVRARYQEAFDYVMVDEFPDTDISQMRMIDTIVKPKGNIVVVGDSNQSIFGWRGGDLSLFLNFKEWYPKHETILLGRNYRSVGPIIETYKKIITGAPSVVPGFLEAITSHRQGGTEVQIWTSGDEAEEGTKVAADISYRLNRPVAGAEKPTYAIIVRTNRQMRILEEKLSAAAAPYVIVGASSFFNRPEVRQVVAYLRVLEDPADDEAMTGVILGKSKLTKYLGKAYVELLKEGPGAMMDKISTTGKPWQRQKGLEIERFFENLEREYGSMHVADQLKVIVDRVGILSILTDEEDLDDIDNSVEENIQELIKAAQSYDSRERFLAYVDALSRKPTKESAPVKILTAHRAKGKEFDVVYVCGFNDDILPHKRAEDIEEERRIAYVAISRAKEELVISSYGIGSRFLKYLQVEETA